MSPRVYPFSKTAVKWKSLVNCLPCLLKTCSRTKVPCMLTCSHANESCVLKCSRAKIPCILTCSCANEFSVLTCLRANKPCVLMCSRTKVSCLLTCSRANMSCVLTCARASVPYLLTCQSTLHTCVLLGKTWENVQCILVLKFSPDLSFFIFTSFNTTPLMLLVKIILIWNCKSVKRD